MNVLDAMRLDGRTAVVTGGAGLYGRQIVHALTEAGAHVVMASRSVETIEAFAKTLSDAGYHASAVSFDQGDPDASRRLLDHVLHTTGRMDILVNNAVSRPMKDWSDSIDAWAESMRVNATGLFAITRCFGEHMAKQGKGSIINVGSMQGMVGPDFSLYDDLEWTTIPDYFFHKGGMIQLTRFAAAKLGPSGVRCNVICPGGLFSGQDQRFVQRYEQRTMLGRMANETDLKGVIVFLASDASAYITGANIPVDGGYTAK